MKTVLSAAVSAALLLTLTYGCHTPTSSAAPIGQPIIGHAAITPPRYTTVDSSGVGANTYRIPSAAVTNDGALVACYDARRNSPADLPSDIDIVCRRSPDEGTTWGPQIVAAPHSGGGTDATAVGSGDGSLLYDSRTGRLFLSYESAQPNTGLYGSDTSTTTTSTTTVHPMIRHSDDDGATWSAPTDLITALKTSAMTGLFASSGHGIQLADGTLVQPYASLIGGTWTSWLAYSTDDGLTWHRSPFIGTGESENKVIQLDDGSLLDDGRPTVTGVDNRLFSRSATLAGPWTVSAPQAALPDPQCNADILRVGTDQPRASWLLESGPASPTQRVDLVIHLSKNDGATWSASWTVEPGVAGYSTMVALPDGFGLFYEHQSPASLVFVKFNLGAFK